MRLNDAPSMCATARARSVFALPGRAFEEDVPVRDGGDEQQLDGAVLADDDLRHLGLRPLAQIGEVVVLLLHHQRHGVSFRLACRLLLARPALVPQPSRHAYRQLFSNP